MNVPSFPHFFRGGLLVALAFASHANGATLKSETVLAWNDYLQGVNDTLQSRLDPGGSFLWTLEDPDLASTVRAGEILIFRMGQVPKKVPGGLIHHWMGAAFLANTDIDHVLAILRDYDHYKDYYRPSVVQSKSIARNGGEDKAWMVFLNKSFFMKNALDVDYDITNIRLDENRCYRLSITSRAQEVERHGESGAALLPEGQGEGFAWKLYTITRLQQRDHGVYLELEAIQLSRGIPAILRFFIVPMGRNVSRKLLFLSIQQTREALARTDNHALMSSGGRQSGSR